MAKVKHIIKSGLKHGKYYKVYVTQVNTAGIESPKSNPAIIRVGDVLAPPVPILSIDATFGVNGYRKVNGFVDVGLSWTEGASDDLSHFIIYTWYNFDFYTADGEYDKSIIPSASTQRSISNGTLKCTLEKQKNNVDICIGIQAIDFSHNASNIYVIKVKP